MSARAAADGEDSPNSIQVQKNHWRRDRGMPYVRYSRSAEWFELQMMRRSTFLPSAAASWSKEELHQLRTLAHTGASIDAIAKTLKRTASAVRNKAGMHGISLAGPRPDVPSFATEAVNA
jgi:hypothetical protein